MKKFIEDAGKSFEGDVAVNDAAKKLGLPRSVLSFLLSLVLSIVIVWRVVSRDWRCSSCLIKLSEVSKCEDDAGIC